MHTHAYVPEVCPLVKDRREVTGENFASRAGGPMALNVKTIDARLAEMDRQGIDMQVVSPQSTQPGGSVPPSVGGATHDASGQRCPAERGRGPWRQSRQALANRIQNSRSLGRSCGRLTVRFKAASC
jgi:hypothetical protein